MPSAQIIKSFLNCADQVTDGYAFTQEQKDVLKGYFAVLKTQSETINRAELYYSQIFDGTSTEIPTQICTQNDRESGMLFAAIYLARLWALDTIMLERGIPKKYIQKAEWHYQNLFERNRKRYGSYGFCGMYRDGMVQYILPRSYTLGRLTFEMGTFAQNRTPYCVYQNTENGKTRPIASEGFFYLANGRRVPNGDDVPNAFQPTCSIQNGELRGYTFDENGLLHFEEIRLDMAKWKPILTEKEDVLWVHIPGSEPLTEESVSKSLQTAKFFFRAYYPHKSFRAFVCSSWLLDSALQAYLKPTSNILAFQRKFRIVLAHVNPMALYWNIFNVEEAVPLSELVPHNRFQTQILKKMQAGDHLYSGNGYILFNDVESAEENSVCV